MGCHFLIQGIFLTQGSNPCLLHCRWILFHCTTWETHLNEFNSIFSVVQTPILESFLSFLFLSHMYPSWKQILLVLPSKYNSTDCFPILTLLSSPWSKVPISHQACLQVSPNRLPYTLQPMLNPAARMIFKILPDHVTCLLKSLQRLPISLRVNESVSHSAAEKGSEDRP